MFYIDFGVLLITEINFPNNNAYDAYDARAVKSPDLLKNERTRTRVANCQSKYAIR